MVIPLRPGRFYGRSLPRPWIYTDIKLSSDRVDPPTPVMDPLISWAEEAHWSMGGRCRTRLRLQGKIEGNVKKLKEQIEKSIKKREESVSPFDQAKKLEESVVGDDSIEPPRAPIVGKKKRKRVMTLLVDEDDDEESSDGGRGGGDIVVEERGSGGGGGVRKWRRLVRKLKDDFDQVAGDGARDVDGDLGSIGKMGPMLDAGDENGGRVGSVAVRTRSHGSERGSKVADEGRMVNDKRNGRRKVGSEVSGEKGSIGAPNGARSSRRLMTRKEMKNLTN
ncbi:hypothetical protein Droror1_Dr00019302 [Drosera rotundifolia]